MSNLLQEIKDYHSLNLMTGLRGLMNSNMGYLNEVIDEVLGARDITPDVLIAWIEEVAQELQVDLAPFLPFIHKTIAYTALHNHAYEMLDDQLDSFELNEEDRNALEQFVDRAFSDLSKLRGEVPGGEEVQLTQNDIVEVILAMMSYHMTGDVSNEMASYIKNHLPR